MGNTFFLIMNSYLYLLGCLVLATNSLSVEKTKAASPLTNCGCQCSSLTFRDSAGQVQGNCNTVDSTGAQWCYVDSYSTCQDLVPSKRFPHNPWSYEACATPALGSSICPNYPSHPVPHPAPAPSHPLPSHPHPAYPHPAIPTDAGLPLGPPVQGSGLPLGPPVQGSGLPLGPPIVQESPLSPAGVGLGDARQASDEDNTGALRFEA